MRMVHGSWEEDRSSSLFPDDRSNDTFGSTPIFSELVLSPVLPFPYTSHRVLYIYLTRTRGSYFEPFASLSLSSALVDIGSSVRTVLEQFSASLNTVDSGAVQSLFFSLQHLLLHSCKSVHRVYSLYCWRHLDSVSLLLGV